MRIEKVISIEHYDLNKLLEDSLAQGFKFVQKLIIEHTAGTNRFDKSGESLFVSIIDGEVVGIGGLNIDPYLDRNDVGRVRHVYVLSRHRGKGIGKILLSKIIEEAREHFGILTLYTENPVADELYRNNGFIKTGGIYKASHVLDLN